MKNKKTIIAVVVLVLVFLAGTLFYKLRAPSDKCTDKDSQINNCVPAGRCTPPGHPLEYVTDCPVAEYDKKYDPNL